MGTSPQSLDVLFLTHNFPRFEGDYAGRFLERFARLLAGRGVRVGVVAPHHPGAAEFEDLAGIPVWRFRYGADSEETLAYRGDWGGATVLGPHGLMAHYRFFSSFKRTACRVVRETSPRVVHAHWWIPAGWVARSFGRNHRLLVTSHGTDTRLLQRKPWMRPLAARVFRRAAMVTTVSNWLADSLREMSPELDGKLGVAPMPPEDAAFSGAVRPATGSPPLILCVTRYTVQKRNEVFLRALDRLRVQSVEFRCRLVGDGGTQRERIFALIQELQLSDRIEIVPSMPQSQLAEEYRRADITVLPAVDEGLGLTLIEAQLCGCAAIGARSGGIADIIEDGKTGLLFRPDDPDDFAAALARLCGDTALRVRLAAAGQESARQRFSSAAIVDRFLGWYQLG